ncbi:TSUP family transporter [Sphingomonas sp.]|uniref:TSUP family transporter n=1 Tax=Sphingomonas sp. TaxID=28214 RepID=UPI0025FA57D9|nr:TSUP family transporter [Sphingomonas sp.]
MAAPLFLPLLAIAFAGAFAQSSTGVGFGVVAGPFLVRAHGYERAIAETVLFSLLVALISAARQFAHRDTRATRSLLLTLPVGVLLGGIALRLVPQRLITLIFGLILSALGCLLLVRSVAGTPRAALDERCEARGAGTRRLAIGGVAAGAAALLFAAPGPAAAWGLAGKGLPADAVRGTLAAYFVAAYGLILVTLAATGAMAGLDWIFIGAAAGASGLGAVGGLITGKRFSAGLLDAAIALVVAASGLMMLSPLLREVL